MSVFLGILAFYVAFGIATFILSLILNVLIALPLIGNLVGFFFHVRGDTPSMLIACLAGFISYGLCLIVIERISKGHEAMKKACGIAGTLLIAFNVICLVLNIIFGNPLITNIIFVIAGFFIRNYTP